MDGSCSSKSNISSFNSNDDENRYCQLLEAYKELREEATQLQHSNNKHKRGE